MAGRVGAVLFLCVMVCVSGGCFLRPAEKTVELPETPSLSGGYGWGVITEPYTSFLDTPGRQGIIAAHGRRGEILEVAARRIVNDDNVPRIWFRFEQGWLPETSVRIFSNIYQARTAAAELL